MTFRFFDTQLFGVFDVFFYFGQKYATKLEFVNKNEGCSESSILKVKISALLLLNSHDQQPAKKVCECFFLAFASLDLIAEQKYVTELGFVAHSSITRNENILEVIISSSFS